MDNPSTPSSISQIIAHRVYADYRKSGISLNGLATQTGIPRTTLRRKLDGHAAFNVPELLTIAPHVGGDFGKWIDGLTKDAA